MKTYKKNILGGCSPRFQLKSYCTPGPGNYNDSLPKKSSFNIKQPMHLQIPVPISLAWIKTERLNIKKQYSPGPGTYFPQNTNKTNSKSIKFKRSNRFQIDKQQITNSIYKQQKKKLICRKQTSNFASKTVRSIFDQLIYRTKNKDIAQLRQAFNIKNYQPCPGFYQNYNKAKGGFSLYKGQRFKNFNKARSPGPSQYIVQNQNKHKCFSFSRAQQLKPIKNISPLGPGTYQTSTFIQINNKKTNTFQKEERFKKNININPGPGSYNLQINQQHGIISSFKSQTRKKNQNSEGAQYILLDFYDISKKLRKSKQYLEKLNDIQVRIPAFNCSSQRFN